MSVCTVPAVFVLVTCIFAMSFGSINDTVMVDESIRLTTYASTSPVRAFAVTSSYLWYANEEGVVQLGLKRKEMNTFQKLGSLGAAGVSEIVADQSGNIWIATPEGLAVRKGRSFTVHTAENGLPDNAVNCVAVAGNKGVWVGTQNGAATLRGGAWKAYTKKDGLAGAQVKSIVVDAKGRVWFGTNRGISCLNGNEWSTHDMKSGLSWNNTHAMGYDTKKGALWAAVGENDVNCYDGKSWKIYMSVAPGIRAIMPDTHGRMWFGHEGGVTKFNGEEWVEDPKKHGIPAMGVTCSYVDGKGNLWFGAVQGIMMLSNPYGY